MQGQMSRLDPANKTLFIKGLKQDNPATRQTILEEYIAGAGFKEDIVSIEHVWSGPAGQRKISPNALVEFRSRFVREACLTKLNATNSNLMTDGILICNRAKMAVQLKRNGSLVRALEILKKDARYKGKKIDICWKKEDVKDKNRAVDVDGTPAFEQNVSDLIGSFSSHFQDLAF